MHCAVAHVEDVGRVGGKTGWGTAYGTGNRGEQSAGKEEEEATVQGRKKVFGGSEISSFLHVLG